MGEPARPPPGRDRLPQRSDRRRRSRPSPWVLAAAVVALGVVGFVALSDAPRPVPEAVRRPDPLAAVPSAGPPRYGAPELLGAVADPALSESSGLASSGLDPGVLWTHNDSGDGPFVYCLDLEGATCGVWELAGASARDWEDMAAGPGPDPERRYLFLGDIGDNDRGRNEITVYRVPEPEVDDAGRASTRERPATATGAEALRLRYPDGPHDAEALLVHPTSGDLYVVTKERSGQPGVYRAPAPLDPEATTTMDAVAVLAVPGPPGGLGVLVTGGDIAPDGRRLVLSTYTQALELDLGATPTGDFDAIWAAPPMPVALALRQQGEAIAYRSDGEALLTTSEGSLAPLHQVTRTGSG